MVGDIKVALIVNVMIGPNLNAGLGKESYEVAKGLYNRNSLGKIFCYGVTPDCDLPTEKIVSICQNRLKRIALGWIDRFHKRFPVIRGRRRVEQWMDASYARRLTPDAGDILYCPKPIYPKTIERAKEIGLKTLVETSVLHPRFNMDVVSKEREKLNIKGASGYTDEIRVRNIEKCLEQTDRIFAWSNYVKNSYIRYGVPDKKFLGNEIFSPPGVDIERFVPGGMPDDLFIVMHLSSISIIKGVQYLLEAWDKIASEINGKLLLAGPIDHDMQQILNRYKRNDIEYIGRTTNPVKFYQQASVFVSPSISDAGPRTVLEAMACAVPAIVSSNCGVSESIMHGVDGMIYQYDDVASLADLLRWSFNNRSELQQMGDEARNKVAAYRIDKYSDDVYKRIELIADSADCL